MQLTKTTTRALAVSAALVVSAGSIAGAAVFHLPILGLDRTSVASAESTTARPAAVVHRAVKPRRIVKTRYVNDIVHIPAPASASVQSANTQAAVTLSPVAVAPVAPIAASEPAPTTTTVAEPGPTTSVPGSDVSHADVEGDHEHASEADGTTSAGEPVDDVTAAPAGDQ